MKLNPFKKKQFTGNYKTWKDAQIASLGYDNDQILKRAIHCRDLVLQGSAVYEQDLRLYHDKPFKPESLASLLWVYALEHRLRVLDIGGSLGTSYYIHFDFLKHLDVQWNVVEQKNYVAYAKKHYETEELKFFNIEDSMPQANALYLSGVLAYIEKPYELIQKLLKQKIPYIILDRNHFLENENAPTKLTVQKTNKMAVQASFPCYLFNKGEFMKNFDGYEIIREWKEAGTQSEGMYYGGCLLALKTTKTI